MNQIQISCLIAGIAGGCAYQPGSFDYARDTFPGRRVTVGCLDIAVDRRADMPAGPVLAYQFANRCDRIMSIDLGALAVVGRGFDGFDLPLAPYDPRHEIHPVALDARNVGTEALAYDSARPITSICVDVTSFVTAAGSPATERQWQCFAAEGAAAEPKTSRISRVTIPSAKLPFAIPVIVERDP
jgi:hypothetical protein